MATVPRLPVFVNRRETPLSRTTLTVTASLLTTLLGPSAPPIRTGGAQLLQAQLRPGNNWLPADTSRGMPKTLFADAAKRFAPQVQSDPAQHPGSERPNADTSQGQPLTLRAAVVVPPFFSGPSWIADSRALRRDTNTSQGQSIALLGTPAPFIAPAQYQVERFRQSSDTSADMPKVLFGDAVPPFSGLAAQTVDRRFNYGDTSQGQPQTLGFVPAPFTAQPGFYVSTQPPASNTSYSLNVALATAPTPPPFAAGDWPAPISFKQFFEPSGGSVQNPDAIPPAVIVPVAPSVGGEYGREKKKRFTVKRGDELLIFGSKQAALSVLMADVPKLKKKTEPKPEPVPEETIALPEVKAYAEKTGQTETYNTAFDSQQYEKLIAIFEQMRDEEEVELLLLHVT